MELKSNKIYSVMTGDIISSGQLKTSHKSTIPDILKNVTKQAKKAFPGTILYDISIFRGDSWQLVIDKPEQALRLALYFRASLISRSDSSRIDTRIGIGIGKIDYLPEENISAGNGEAFLLSGEALEVINKKQTLHLRHTNAKKEAYFNIILGLIDTISQDWSSKQARAVKGALQGMSQSEIATIWQPEISQQSVTRHLNRAGWQNLVRALDFFAKDISHDIQLY